MSCSMAAGKGVVFCVWHWWQYSWPGWFSGSCFWSLLLPNAVLIIESALAAHRCCFAVCVPAHAVLIDIRTWSQDMKDTVCSPQAKACWTTAEMQNAHIDSTGLQAEAWSQLVPAATALPQTWLLISIQICWQALQCSRKQVATNDSCATHMQHRFASWGMEPTCACSNCFDADAASFSIEICWQVPQCSLKQVATSDSCATHTQHQGRNLWLPYA